MFFKNLLKSFEVRDASFESRVWGFEYLVDSQALVVLSKDFSYNG